MRRLGKHAAALALLLLLSAWRGASLPGSPPQAGQQDPPIPANITQVRRSTLEHGLRLAKEGKLEFARAHFADARLPVPCPVQFVVDGVPRDRRQDLIAAARVGMDMWNKAFPGEVRFVEEKDPAKSYAQVFFVPVAVGFDEKTGRPQTVCGWTKVDAPHEGMRVPHHGTILVAIYRPGGRAYWADATITHVVAHELGHVIGIGEASDPQCIMGPNSAHPSVALTPADIKAVRDVLDCQRALVERYGLPGSPARPQ